MAQEKPSVTIIRKVKKGGHGHHGGAWKVAYADFVTAMMAFFMVMWLLGTSTKEQLAAISQYFKNPSMQAGTSQTPAPGMNGPGGASNSMIQLGGTMDMQRGKGEISRGGSGNPSVNVAEAEKIAEQADHQRLEELKKQLEDAIDNSEALKAFKDQLLLDITPEGLRIQIVDKKNRPMFDLGSAHLKSYTLVILKTLAPFLDKVPNKISIAGHTDETPYSRDASYTNWELSADRANAARRALVEGGLKQGKVARVVGLGATVLFDRADPLAPINRRISIIVLNRRTEKAIAADNGDGVAMQLAPAPASSSKVSPAITASAVKPAPAGTSVVAHLDKIPGIAAKHVDKPALQ